MPERKLSYLLVSFFLVLSLGIWIISYSLAQTVGQATQTKELLRESGIYEAIIPSQLAEAQKNNPAYANIPLQNADVQKLLAKSVDSQELRTQGDKAVDAIYNWLEGKNDKPLLAIDVTADPQALGVSLSELAAKRAAELPACVPGVDDYSTFSNDPIGANCLPPGVTPETVRSYVTQAVQNNPALASTNQLKEEDVKLSNGKTIMESLNAAPVWYQRAQWVPTVSLVAAIVFVLLMVVILRPVRGTRYVGKHLLAVGITLSLVAYGLAWLFTKIYELYIPKSDNPNISEALARLSTHFNTTLRDNVVELGLGAAAIGLVLFVTAFVIGKLSHAPAVRPVRLTSDPSPDSSLGRGPALTSFTPLAGKVAKKVSGAPALPKSPKKSPAKRKTATGKKPASRSKKSK